MTTQKAEKQAAIESAVNRVRHHAIHGKTTVILTIEDASTLANAAQQLEAQKSQVIAEFDAIFGGERVEVQFDRGDYRINYFGYKPSDTFGLWSASSLRTGKYVGDPRRFYPLTELLQLIEKEMTAPEVCE